MITKWLKIILWDKEIGRLSWDNRKKIAYFEYNPTFLEGDINPFPLTASIASPASKRPIWGNKENKLYRNLPPFLADSLPDAWGNQVFECWRVQNNIHKQEITPLDHLTFIGKRAMGALEFTPETLGLKKTERLNLKALTELAQRVFIERENIKIQPNESLTMQSLIAVGTSAGGRQPKAIIAINSKTGDIISGQIGGQEDFEYYILKFGDASRSSAEIEMAYYEMAQAAGIDIMPCNLIDIEGNKHFVTRRFDRTKEGKLHIQTLAALYPEANSYEDLLMICRKLRLPASASEEVFRRMVFNILTNNTDDHNKNFSFMMNKQGKWSIAPAYDLTFIFNIGGFLPDTTHCLMMQGKLSNHTKEDALALAKENGIKKAESIINQVASAIAQFRIFAEKHLVEERWICTIENRLTELLKQWDLNYPEKKFVDIEIGNTLFKNVHIEQSYKGNFHLIAIADGITRKYVIGKNKTEYTELKQNGITNIDTEYLKHLIVKYLLNSK